jgi:3-oxoadipate enol-lactonase
MVWLESEWAWAMTQAWAAECEAAGRATLDALAGAFGGMSTFGSRPKLHWERTGSGPPVLLIMGLGLSGGAWWRTTSVLADHLQVVTFDNRGIGRSRAVVQAYSTEVMADDAASVLDDAGIEHAHVYGVSLGGMVAQQVALRHPERVTSLVLGATYAGGPCAYPPSDEVLAFLRRRAFLAHEEAALRSVPFNYSEACRTAYPERIDADLAQRLTNGFAMEAYWAQLWAAATHDTYARLPEIAAPTLVVHGTADRMIPVQNGRVLAERIPGARLTEIPGAGHLYPTEAPEIDDEISTFMVEHS